MLKHILLDLHDTLIHDKAVHNKAQAKLCQHLESFGFDNETVLKALDEITNDLQPSIKCSRARIVQIFRSTLTSLIPHADNNDINTAEGFAKEIHQTAPELRQDVAKAVKLLCRYFPTSVITSSGSGVDHISKQINSLPFKDKLSDVLIVDRKDKRTYQDILEKTGCDAGEMVMIGNCRRSDILPASEANMQSIYIDADESAYFSDHTKVRTLPKNSYEFTSLLEAAQHIVTYKTAAPSFSFYKYR